MKRTRPISQQGFTLLEALIASLVVAVAMLGVARLQGVTMLDSSDSRMKTRALNLAQEKIEELRGFANQDTYLAMASGTDAPGSHDGDSSGFTRTWTITHESNYLQINSKVEWDDPKGDHQAVQLTSYIARSEPVKSGMVLAL